MTRMLGEAKQRSSDPPRSSLTSHRAYEAGSPIDPSGGSTGGVR